MKFHSVLTAQACRCKWPKLTRLHINFLEVSSSQSPKRGKDNQTFVDVSSEGYFWVVSTSCLMTILLVLPHSVLCHTMKETFLQRSFEGLKSVFFHRTPHYCSPCLPQILKQSLLLWSSQYEIILVTQRNCRFVTSLWMFPALNSAFLHCCFTCER